MRPIRALSAALGLVLMLAACGDDDAGTATTSAGTTVAGGFDFGSESPTTTVATAVTTTLAGSGPGEEGGDTDAGPLPPLTAEQLSRMIVYTATIHVEVDDLTAATAEAVTALTGLGGIVFGQETTTGEEAHSVLTIKVPPDRFNEALERLAGVGELISQRVNADDVTERVVDLQSRIATAAVSVDRLRDLIATAPGIEEVIELERELLERETDLELLRGQVRTLEDAVALATITLVLSEPQPERPEPAVDLVQTVTPSHEGGRDCPGRDQIDIDEGAAMTVCFIVTNAGDTGLTEIEVGDAGQRLDPDDAIVVEGDLSQVLQPGERLVLAFETEAVLRRELSPTFVATAVDADGDPLFVEIEFDLEVAQLRVIEDTSLPGFTDSLQSAWRGMQWLFGLAVVAAGAAIPFLWVPAIAGGVWWWRQRRDEG